MSDPEAILDALAAGLSVEKTAKRFHVPVAEVRRILRDEVDRCRDGEHLREVWALADRRLAAVEVKFYNESDLSRRQQADRSCRHGDDCGGTA